MRKPRQFRPEADRLEARWVLSHVGVTTRAAPAGLTPAEVRAEHAAELAGARTHRLALPHRVSGHRATTDPSARARLSATQTGGNVTSVVGIPSIFVGVANSGFPVTNGLGFRGLAVTSGFKSNGLVFVTTGFTFNGQVALTTLTVLTSSAGVQFTQFTTSTFGNFASPIGLGLNNGLILTNGLGSSFNVGLGLNNGLILTNNVGLNNGLILNNGVGLISGVGSNPGVSITNGLIIGSPILTGSAGLNNGMLLVV